MTDETFGPTERRSINPAEFKGNPVLANNPALANSIGFEQVAENQRQMGRDVPNHAESPRFTGNLPPELVERLENRNKPEDNAPMRIAESSRMTQKPKQKAQDTSHLRATGSSKLEELMLGAKEATYTYEKITLPSLGKFYNGEDGPANGVLHIRPMTGEEEAILATPRFVKRGDAVNMIFDKCIKENYKSENLLSADRTFLLIWLRGISYGPDYQVELICPFTEKKFTYTIDLNLDVDMCPDDFDVNSLQDKLPVTGYNFAYRLARGRDELAIQAHRERKAKMDVSTKPDDSLVFRTAQLIEDIEGLSNKIELEMLLNKLPVADGNHIRNLVNEPPFGADTKITITSPFTLEEFEVDLPLDTNFFFPRRQKKARD